MAFTVATFIAFTVLVAVLSWWKTRDDDLSTKEGYFLAGRGLPGIVIAGSLMMTNLSAEQLVGTNGQAFAGNMSTMAWEATSAFALIVLAFVFLPKLLRGGIATIPEFFEMRYDTFTMRLFSLLFLIAYVVTMLPTILYSGAVALVKIFDLESMFGISYFSAITIICIGTGIIGMCYAVFGGLKAQKMFYALTVLIDDETAGEVMQDDWLESMAQETLCCMCARKPGTSDETARKLRRSIVNGRLETGKPVLLLDWDGDVRYLNNRISEYMTFGSVLPEGSTFPLQLG